MVSKFNNGIHDPKGQGTIILASYNLHEPRHEISNSVVCATSKGSDQPVNMRDLIRALASRLNIL